MFALKFITRWIHDSQNFRNFIRPNQVRIPLSRQGMEPSSATKYVHERFG